jgi:hypothetical protein
MISKYTIVNQIYGVKEINNIVMIFLMDNFKLKENRNFDLSTKT